MNLQQHFARMARYNAWANERLYGLAFALPDALYRKHVGAYFKSLHGTLNQLLTTGRIWLWRLTGEGTHPDRLDAIVFDELAALAAARRQQDQRLIRFVDGTLDSDLAKLCDYRTLGGAPHQQVLGDILAHLANHQTHHRGQAHGILSALGVEPLSLDLLTMQREP
jgi:uncharacterized damage-inducible protein DinB